MVAAQLEHKQSGDFRPDISTILHDHLPLDRLHEIFAATAADAASALAFMQLLSQSLLIDKVGVPPCFLIRLTSPEIGASQIGPSLPRVDAVGLNSLGLDPAGYLQVHAPDIRAMLCAAADIARCPAAGAVLLEVHGNPRLVDLTATRRLALAAEKSGVIVLLLRINANPTPSAAYSRWQIRSAASQPLPGNAPGFARFAVEMLRHRKFMAASTALLEWDHEQHRFRAANARNAAESHKPQTALGALSAIPVRQPDSAQSRRATG
jgi:protein ImuA